MITKLKLEMERQGISARELSSMANVGSSFIYDLLSGRSANPTTKKISAIANALGVSLSYLLSGSKNTTEQTSLYSDFISVPLLINSNDKNIIKSDSYLFKKAWVTERLKTMPENLNMVIVSGDGMYPSIKNSDIALVDNSCKTPIESGIFILLNNSITIARRMEFVPINGTGEVFIYPDNPKYKSYTCNISELEIIGRVVWTARAV